MTKMLFAFGAIIFLGFSSNSVSAATGDNIYGWSWGGTQSIDGAYNGIGWISMNSSECDTNNDGTIDNPSCGSGSIGQYGVNIPTTDGVVSGTGYVWSEYYGWIDFRPDLHCVTGAPGPGQYRADSCVSPEGVAGGVVRSLDKLKGWARIVAIATAAANGNSGGYTGWVSMSSLNPTIPASTVSYAPEIIKMTRTMVRPDCNANPSICTFAWSEDLGWIEMSMSGYDAAYKICPPGLTLNEGESQDLTPFYNASGDFNCLDTSSATDVSAGKTWTSDDAGIASVNNITGLVTGISAGGAPSRTTQVNISNHLTKSAASVPVTVLCASDFVSLCEAERPTRCPDESILIVDRCGNRTGDPGFSCNGSKNCSFNPIEVSP